MPKYNRLHQALIVLSLLPALASAQSATRPIDNNEPDLSTPATQSNDRDAAAIADALSPTGWYTLALPTRDNRLAWWRDARFGCFIHWGVYSALAGSYNGKRGGGYAEHIMRVLKIPREEYLEKVAAPFNPEKFNADDWVTLIRNAGMKYLVITAKHHDGFAMYPSDATPYNLRDTSHFPRDPMAELSAACKKAGIHFGFYYSHAFDWEHPDAPGNDWDYQNPGGDKHLFGGERWYDAHPELLPRIQHYVDTKAIPQLLELVHKYHPDIFWFDTSGKLPLSEQIRIVKAVRQADPNVVINGRAARGLGHNFGDYQDTADRPAEVRDPGGDWEAIPSVNNSYGYNAWDNHYHTADEFIQLIAKTAAKGGNTLLNIGPKGDGTIDENATRILTGIGQWMQINATSIHNTTRTPLDRQSWGDSTLKGQTLYLHLFTWPIDGQLIVGGLQSTPATAYVLSDPQKSPLKFDRLNDNDLAITLPATAPDKTDSVLVLQFGAPPQTTPGHLLLTNVPTNRLLAFDAKAEGKGIKYGDGKENNYYVAGLTSPSHTLTWPCRLDAPATFTVTVTYSTSSPDQTGTYDLRIANQTLPGTVAPTAKTTSPQTATLGQVNLPAGPLEIQLHPKDVKGSDLMNVFDVTLTPVP